VLVGDDCSRPPIIIRFMICMQVTLEGMQVTFEGPWVR
jgi:hypothetical protein